MVPGLHVKNKLNRLTIYSYPGYLEAVSLRPLSFKKNFRQDLSAFAQMLRRDRQDN
jgi:hypothetical protein